MVTPGWRRLADDRRAVWSDASRSVDAVGAGGSMDVLLIEGKCTKSNHDDECNVSHF
jgi:hypothetical protein